MTFWAQTEAVVRRQALAQRRSMGLNACLLSLPLIFCALLFGLQQVST